MSMMFHYYYSTRILQLIFTNESEMNQDQSIRGRDEKRTVKRMRRAIESESYESVADEDEENDLTKDDCGTLKCKYRSVIISMYVIMI